MNPAREMASIFTANCSAAGFASSSGANLEQAKMMKILLNPVHVTPSTGGDGDAGRMKDDENDSKSASESQEHEGGSGDEEEDFNHHQRLGKKRYHRHTQEQIQAMEAFFKECPHPDDKQRKELSRELGLEPLQVKFWFQNKRTQLKMHHERFENTQLRNKNEKLRAENMQYKELLRNASCRSCGGPTALCQVSFNEHHLRIENARLRQEIDRISDLAAKYVGKPPSDEEILPPGSPRTYEPADHEDKLMIAELAVAAMEELTAMAQMGDPLWLTGNDNRTYMLNEAEYLRTFPRAIGVRPHGFKCEASRETAVVMMNHTKIVEILMDENQWSTVFSGIISGALTLEILSPGVGGSYNGALQVITAEFQVLSPLVPTRETYFLRYCKNHGNGTWAVVDVSLDSLRVSSSVKCQRRPSGCLIQEMPNGYSKVTWVEHVEVDDEGVHNIYRPLVNSGLAFGAKRWLSTLDRQCERLANAMAPNLSPSDFAITSREGRRGVLKLAERMVMSFCGGVGHTTAHTWTILTGSGADDVRVMTRRSVDDPGRPHGIALSAATSLWLPAPPKQVFDFLRDERSRNEWDILSNGGVIQEIAHIANGRRTGNCISLLRTGGGDQSNMLILQESCIDLTGSFVIYAPVDVTAMNKVLDGGDPDYVALLPSGFVILPDGPIRHGGGVGNNGPGGSLLTVAFQILVDTAPDAEISLASVATVNNLIACTAERIKATVAGENA